MLNKSERRQVTAAVIATLGALTIGIILGWTSSAEYLLPKYVKFDVTEEDATVYGSLLAVGAMFGAIGASVLGNLIGNRYSMMLYELGVIAGWVSVTLANSKQILDLGRFIQGIGVGSMCNIIPVYVGEISEQQIRGKLGAMFQVFIVIGILYSYVFGSILDYVPFNAACGIWAVIHLLGLFFIPESPHFLLKKNKDDKAASAMARIRDNPEEAAQELAKIKSTIDSEKTTNDTLSKVFADRSNRKALFIGIGCMFFQQISGINVVIFYLDSIFMKSGSTMNPYTSSIIVGIVQLIATLVTLAFVDKTGRRILLLISAILMALSSACIALCFLAVDKHIDVGAVFNSLPLIFITTYIAAFSLGLGPVPWVIIGEIFSAKVKPYGASMAAITNWGLVAVLTFLPEIMKKSVGMYGMFFIFAGFCALGTAFVWFFVPETKNKSLTEIQNWLASNGRPNASVP